MKNTLKFSHNSKAHKSQKIKHSHDPTNEISPTKQERLEMFNIQHVFLITISLAT